MWWAVSCSSLCECEPLFFCHIWDGGAVTASKLERYRRRERLEVYAAIQYVATFHCQVPLGMIVVNFSRGQKEKWTFVDR